MTEEEFEPPPRPLSQIERALEVRERIDRERRLMRAIRDREIIASVRRTR